ncbi:MAG: Gfo/Idh/MocA family oxidoreductase [Lentisphaerota bacterium]
MKILNVGIIGYGFMGKVRAYGHLVLPIFYDPPPCATRITRVCDGVDAVARKGAEILGARAVTDFREVTESPEVDIVHVCTPNHLHAEAVLSAIAHGKHVLCDKPLTLTMADAEAIAAAIKNYGATGQMAFQTRFFPATMRAKQMITEGFLGQTLEFRAVYLHAGSADPKAPLKWKLSAAAGGGIIADLASHVLDIVHWLLDDYAELLAATHIAYCQRPSADDPKHMVSVDTEDAVLILARMKSGALGSLEATKLATGAEDELRFEIHGSKGALRFNTMDPHHLDAYDAGAPDAPFGGTRGWTRIDAGGRYGPPAVFPGPKFAIGFLRAHLACLASFLERSAAGQPGDPDLDQGVHVQRLMECCKISAREGKWVTVPTQQ